MLTFDSRSMKQNLLVSFTLYWAFLTSPDHGSTNVVKAFVVGTNRITTSSPGVTFLNPNCKEARNVSHKKVIVVHAAAKGFGSSSSASKEGSSKKKKQQKQTSRLVDSLDDRPSEKKKKEAAVAKPYVKSETDDLIASLTAKASNSVLGRAIAEHPTSEEDTFWELIPTLIMSRFPNARDEQLTRVAGFLKHTLNPDLPVEDDIIQNQWRPHDELHAYMPGLGPTKPFHDPEQLELCRQLSANYDTIKAEYEALIDDIKNGGEDRFQSVTSMNYKAGWKTLVLFYNGHRIPNFPYHLCPVTTKILERVPLAGRIAGFNRQQPKTGIPLHSDGNNMWLTCQMGIQVPGDGDAAYIRVGPEKRYWQNGQCLLYDTTYEHETFNDHPTEERVVLHVDFFNTLALTPLEIQIMQYIYQLREEFMKAEGVAKVGAQIL